LHKSSGAVAIIASLIAACGGGGGGGSAPPPPPPPPPPPETIPLALTSANYSLAAELTVDVAEAVLQFAQLASDAADQLQANLQNPGTIACPNGGTLELTFTDSNADGVLNSGDSIQASYHDCYQSSVNDVINGDLTLKTGEAAATMSMDAAPSYAFELQFPAPFTVGSTGSASTVSGSLAVGILRDSFTTTLGAASTAADDLNIAVVANGKNYSEAPRSLVLHKKLDYSAATYELRLAMVYRSQALGGQVTLATRDYVGGYFNTYPIIGLFDLAGAAPNTVELRVGGQYVIPGNEQSTAELSTDGFQTIASSQVTPWASFTAGFLWWEPLSYPGVYPNGYAPQSMDIITPQLALLFTRPVNQGIRPANLPIYFQYSVPVSGSSPQIATLSPIAPAGLDVPVTVSYQGARVVVTPAQALQPGTYSLSTDGVGPFPVTLLFTAQ
jgi:hypothetical protein